MGAERTKTNAPPPTPTLEPPQRAMVSINSHDEVARNNGINDNYGRRNNGSGHNYLHQSQAADSQENRFDEEIMKENLMGAKISKSDNINGEINEQTEIMGMEITIVENNASHALNSTLINVPINYEEQNAHAGHLICTTQPREEPSDMEKQGQLRGAPNNATWKRIQRTQKSKTNPSHQSFCGTKRAQPGGNVYDEEEIQNAKRSKRMEGKKETLNNLTVEAARQPR